MSTITVAAELYWPILFDPMKSRFAPDKPPVCTVNLANLSAKAVEELKAINLSPRKDEVNRPNEGHLITCKSQFAFNVFNKDGTEFDKTKKIGNGTKATVKLKAYKYKNVPGYGAQIQSITIQELVEYNPTPVEELDDVL